MRRGFNRGNRWVWDDYRRQFILLTPGVVCPVPITRRRWGRRLLERWHGGYCDIVSYPSWDQWGPSLTMRQSSGAHSHRAMTEWLAERGFRADFSRGHTYDGVPEYPLVPIDNNNSDGHDETTTETPCI